MFWFKCFCCVLGLICLCGLGLVAAAILLRSPMHVDDECEPIGHGIMDTKAKHRLSLEKDDTKEMKRQTLLSWNWRSLIRRGSTRR